MISLFSLFCWSPEITKCCMLIYAVGGEIVPEKKEEKGKAEEAAEKTGELLGKGLKKGFGIAKGLGKGIKEGVKGEEEKKKKE